MFMAWIFAFVMAAEKMYLNWRNVQIINEQVTITGWWLSPDYLQVKLWVCLREVYSLWEFTFLLFGEVETIVRPHANTQPSSRMCVWAYKLFWCCLITQHCDAKRPMSPAECVTLPSHLHLSTTPVVVFSQPRLQEGSKQLTILREPAASGSCICLGQVFSGVTWLTACQLCCSRTCMTDACVHTCVGPAQAAVAPLKQWIETLKCVQFGSPGYLSNTHTKEHCQVHSSTCQCVCWQRQVRFAGSCVEWDYVNLSLVEELSPTPAHNCQERDEERGKERVKELRKWVGERWRCDERFGDGKNRMNRRETGWCEESRRPEAEAETGNGGRWVG